MREYIESLEHDFSLIENGFKVEEKRALDDYKAHDREYIKELALLAYKSEVYQVRMYGVFLLGYLSEDDDILVFMRDEVSKDDDWRVQEILAKSFDEFCKRKGYQNALPTIDEWMKSSNPNTRRAVTEGLRIWTSRPYFKENPIVLPEEDQTKYFMVSLILQNLYREILTVADENGGRLKNRVVFFADELGTCPPIQSLELMFSASRSRGLMLVPIVQSITGQLQKNYGKEGSEIIVDNCQVNLYGGFAPASQTAVELSKSLGSRTVMSGSISRGKNDPSQSLQMMERPLMTPDELKSMPKGSFIVAKTGVHPMKVKLRLFLDWGIRFGMPYEVPEKAQRFVAYADKQELEESIIRRHYGTIVMDSEQPQGGGTSAGGMAQGIQAAPDSRKTVFRP